MNTWWGHRGPRLLAVGFAAIAVWFVVWTVLAAVVAFWVGTGAVAVAVAGVVGVWKHERYWWCERCAGQSGSSSVFEDKALRRRAWLAYAHVADTVWYRGVVVALLVAGSVLPGYPGDSLLAVLAAIWAIYWWAVDVHQRMAPCCPFCRR